MKQKATKASFLHNLFFYAIGLMACLSLFSCSNDDDKYAASLVGTWELSGGDDVTEDTDKIRWEFTTNGVANFISTINNGELNQTLKWNVKGDDLIIYDDEDDHYTCSGIRFAYDLSKTYLHIVSLNETTLVLECASWLAGGEVLKVEKSIFTRVK